VEFWRTKAAISLKRVNMEEELQLRRACRKLPTLLRTVPPPTPTALPSPRLGVRNPHPKIQSKIAGKRVHIQGGQKMVSYRRAYFVHIFAKY